MLAEGAFCYSCRTKVSIIEVIKLFGEIKQHNVTTKVTLISEIADKVLQFERSLLLLLKENQDLARVLLSEFDIYGAFIVDPHGQIIGF